MAGLRVTLTIAITLGALTWPALATAAPISYHCTFPKVLTLGAGLHDQDFSTTIAYDAVTQTAAVIGDNGVSALQVYAKPGAVTFLEFVMTGAVQSLTLLPNGAAV